MIGWYAAGAAFGALCLIPFIKAPLKKVTANGYMALAMMLSIYIGAYLVSGSTERVLYEILFAGLILGLGTYFKKDWPLGVAGLVFLHAFYDHFFGAQSGVAAWYSPVCAGFDIVVGLGLFYLIFKHIRHSNRQTL